MRTLGHKLEAQSQFTQNKVYKATDGVKTAFITVDSKLYDENVDYFMHHTDTKLICIERALDTTKKFNLKNKKARQVPRVLIFILFSIYGINSMIVII